MPETYINKVTGLRPAVLLKKKLLQRFFPVNLAKFLKNTFFTEQLRTTASSNNILEGILNVRGSCSEMFWCSENFGNINKKTPAISSLFSKFARPDRYL